MAWHSEWESESEEQKAKEKETRKVRDRAVVVPGMPSAELPKPRQPRLEFQIAEASQFA
jgi:hypothetical protein